MSAPNLSVRQPSPLPDSGRLPIIAVSLAVSALLLLLLWEWLRPLPQVAAVTELYDIRPFVAAFGLALLLDGLQIAVKWSAPLKGIIAIALVGRLFYPDQFAGFGWIGELAVQVRDDMMLAVQGQYEQIGGETRTLLFVAGWTMMASVLHALLLQRQTTLWLGGMTLLYLLLMQFCFGVDTVEGVWRTFVWTGLLTALLLPGRLERRYGVTVSGSRSFFWTLGAAVIVAACVAAATFGWRPQHDQRLMKTLDYAAMDRWAAQLGWTDNVPVAAVSAASGALSGQPARTGYASDDTALGGPVVPDSGVVFEAKTSELTYWRGESKSTYDGKGWSQPASKLEIGTPTSGETGNTGNVEAQAVQQEIMLQRDAATRLLFLGGTLSRTDTLVTSQDRMLQGDLIRYDAANGAYSLPELSDPVAYYKVAVIPNRPDEKALLADNGDYPPDISETYLQLPTALPQRVRALAAGITKDSATPYDKAAAIAHYLKQNYAYSFEQAAVPGKQDDFVDHFLFTGKTGYCDYFSTAMAVMLRTVGVPTRWVKGYAPGVEQSSAGGSDGAALHDVIVRNQDAHSWVEVYFPKSGWVAFDPTPGFGGAGIAQPTSADISAGGQAGPAQTSATVTSATLGASPSPLQALGLQALSLDTAATRKASDSAGAAWNAMRGFLQNAVAWFGDRLAFTATGVFLIAAAAYLLLRYRRKLIFAALSLRASLPAAGEPQQSAVAFMDVLWQRLYRQYGRKAPQETMREYVSRLQLPNEANQEALHEFAKLYELARYDTSRRLPVPRRALLGLLKRIVES